MGKLQAKIINDVTTCKKIKCPYCGSEKQHKYKPGEMGNIHSHGVNKIGGFGVTGKTCGKCKKHYSLWTQFFRLNEKEVLKNGLKNLKAETYIKYDVKYKETEKGLHELSYKRKDL